MPGPPHTVMAMANADDLEILKEKIEGVQVRKAYLELYNYNPLPFGQIRFFVSQVSHPWNLFFRPKMYQKTIQASHLLNRYTFSEMYDAKKEKKSDLVC